MSQRRRNEIKRKKKKFWLRLGIMTVAVLLVVGLISYYKFFRRLKPENFIPENPITFLLIDINPNSEQNNALDKLAINLGDEEIFKRYIEGQFFRGISKDNLKIEEGDLKSWLGEKLVISKVKLSSRENKSAHVVEIKNLVKAKDILGTINENVKKRGSVVSTEEFRGTEIVYIESSQEGMAYAFYENFLLFSEDPAGIKMMIDTVIGRNKSLSSDRVYRRIKRKLKGDDFTVFAFVDLVESLREVTELSDQINIPFLGQISSDSRFNMGIVFKARDNGIQMTTLLGGDNESYEKKKDFKPDLANSVPANTAFYWEGQEIQSLAERLLVSSEEGLSQEEREAKIELLKKGISLQLGLDLDKDIFTMLEGRYGLAIFPEKEEKGLSAGLILAREKREEAEDKMKKLEELAVREINDKIVKEGEGQVGFIDQTYKNVPYRLAKLPASIKVDIYYAVLTDKIIIATGPKAFGSLVDAAEGTTRDVLAENEIFRNTYQEINSEKATRLVYLNLPHSLTWLDNFNYLEYDTLQDEYRRLRGVGFLSQSSNEGGWAEGFLSVKED
ncbi:DUF3352 domain-containing protein [Patescibacteria group bacterium]|nr:DUF3352 domain-containing protein [Patescibacteria group bacterium]